MTVSKRLGWYLAGPMRGYPQDNFPLFIRVAAELRAEGYVITSPVELDDPETVAVTMSGTEMGGKKPGFILGRDVQTVHDGVDGLILLPGWWDSRGTKIEVHVGLVAGKKFAYYEPTGSYDYDDDSIRTVARMTELTDEQVRATLRRFL